MPRWFGGKDDDGVPREWRSALEKALRPLDPASEQVGGRRAHLRPDRIARGGAHQRDRTRLRHAPPSTSGAGSPGPRENDALLTLCSRLADVPPEVAVRLGRVVEASAAHSFALGQPAHLRWLEALLLGFANAVDNAYAARVRLPLDFTVVEELVRSTGRPAGEVLAGAFHATGAPSYYRHGRYRVVLRGLQGYPEAVARHAEALRPALASTKVDDRLVALEMLDGLPADVLGPVRGRARRLRDQHEQQGAQRSAGSHQGLRPRRPSTRSRRSPRTASRATGSRHSSCCTPTATPTSEPGRSPRPARTEPPASGRSSSSGRTRPAPAQPRTTRGCRRWRSRRSSGVRRSRQSSPRSSSAWSRRSTGTSPRATSSSAATPSSGSSSTAPACGTRTRSSWTEASSRRC